MSKINNKFIALFMLVKEILGEKYNNFYEHFLYYTDTKYKNKNMIYTNLGLFTVENEDVPYDKYEQITMAKIYKEYLKNKNLKLFRNLEYLELHIDEINYDLFDTVCELKKLKILSLVIFNLYIDNIFSCKFLCNLPNISTLLINLNSWCIIEKGLNNLPTSLENIIFITSKGNYQSNYVEKIIKNIKLPLSCRVYHLHNFNVWSDGGFYTRHKTYIYDG